MDDNTQVLNEIYKAASMGAESLNVLIPATKDSRIKNTLRSQLETYNHFIDDVKKDFNLYGEKPKEVSALSKAMMDIGVKMNAWKDDSQSHISEMMIQGTNMGIVDLTKALNHHQNVDSRVRTLAGSLLEFEQNSISAYKNLL